jgi:putative sigma-54 modulation protein
MRIEVRGKNTEVTDEIREAVVQRFERVGKQVSELATLEIELCEEKNPRIAERMVAEATLGLKGVTLRAKEASPDMLHSIHELAEDIRRQVKKHRDKRRKRQTTRKMMARLRGRAAKETSRAAS